eukprot:TRINITY_DN6169_c0_g3_i1.p2 TRINITY_DN6169_c0_g3~~TRINITY_DN6169_c0_g3_i1.p2  ORF type:complete len:266 (+),score=24.34 TRINITY_DN6169_c0_g3_i1:157-954(+)
MKLQLQPGCDEHDLWSANLKLSAKEASFLSGLVHGSVQLRVKEDGALTCKLKLKTRRSMQRSKSVWGTWDENAHSAQISDKKVSSLHIIQQKESSFRAYGRQRIMSQTDMKQNIEMQEDKIREMDLSRDGSNSPTSIFDFQKQGHGGYIENEKPSPAKFYNGVQQYTYIARDYSKVEAQEEYKQESKERVIAGGILGGKILSQGDRNLQKRQYSQKQEYISKVQRRNSDSTHAAAQPPQKSNCGPIVAPEIDHVWNKPTVVLFPW